MWLDKGFVGWAVAAGVAMGLGAMGVAQADVARFVDANNDTSSSADIRVVQVDNTSTVRGKVIVRILQDKIRVGDSVEIFFDTRPRDPGPEFSIGGTFGSEYGMNHRERWGAYGPFIPYRCGYRMKGDYTDGRTRVAVPRKCLGNPGKIRVAVRVERGNPPTSRDWARAPRTWLGWVHR
jgi:hypothetical protein